jgi:PAS domain S-box-containing protein
MTDQEPAARTLTICQHAEELLHAYVHDLQSPSGEEIQLLVQQCEARRCELEAHNDELRKVQHQLERYRDRYIDLYDFAPLGYVTLDEDGYVQEMNLAGAKMLGADRAAVIGYSLLEYVVEPDRAALLEHVRACVTGKQEATCEIRILTKDGRQTAVHLRSIPVEEQDQTSIFCKTAFTDITQLKQAEAQLKAANETLEQRVAQRTAEAEHRALQLQALASQLSQTEQRERHRLAQIVQDHLQQLLIAAKLKLSTLSEHLRDAALRCTAAQTESLLEQSIAESRAVCAELSPPVLYEAGLAAGLEWLIKRMRQKYNLEIEAAVDLLADPADEGLRVLLFQAIHELLLNVVEHAQTNRARISVARTAESQVQIEVVDDGIGFDPAHIKASEATAGGAFGLFGIRERLDTMGGCLEIHSTPGKGSRMVLVAPLLPAQPPAPSAWAAVEGAAAPRSAKLPEGVTRVLLADDHPIVRRGLAELLQQQPEIEVVGEACDGEEAFVLALRFRPDVVLMDANMPKLDGMEATRRIKAQMPEIRVIGLSMYEEGEIPSAMRSAGVETYISKSAPAEALLAAVLAPRAASVPHPIQSPSLASLGPQPGNIALSPG